VARSTAPRSRTTAPSAARRSNIDTSIRDVEADRFDESFKPFEDCTRIDIVWKGSGELDAPLLVRVDGEHAPDPAPLPRPGPPATLVEKGAVKPAADRVKAAAEAYHPNDWLSYGTVEGASNAPPLGAGRRQRLDRKKRRP
jgi:alpha-glucoside transport system substrate-binding protein